MTSSKEPTDKKPTDDEIKIFNFGEFLKYEKKRFLLLISPILIPIIINVIKTTTGIDLWAQLPNLLSKQFAAQPIQLVLFLTHIIFIFVVLITILVGEYEELKEEKMSDKDLEKEKLVWKKLAIFEVGEITDSQSLPVHKDENHSSESGSGDDGSSKDNEEDKLQKRKVDEWRKFREQVNKVIGQFFIAWWGCWFGWLVLYFVLLFFALVEYYPKEDLKDFSKIFIENLINYKSVFSDAANNFSSLMILIMYFTLRKKTTKKGYFILVAGIGIGGIVFCMFLSAAMIHFFKTDLYLSILSSFFASITMALFFGSLNSFFNGVPPKLIVCLHIYAAIQILFIFESDSLLKYLQLADANVHDAVKDKFNNLMTLFFGVAFFLKILLFLIVHWLLKTARFTFSIVHKKSSFLANKEDKLLKQFVSIVKMQKFKMGVDE